MKKFQLDFTNVPSDLRSIINKQALEVLNNNGWGGLLPFLGDNPLIKNSNSRDENGNFCSYLVFGSNSNKVTWNPIPFEPNNYRIYRVYEDWDEWTLIKFKDEIEIQTGNKDFPYALVDKQNKTVKVGCQVFDFDFVIRLNRVIKS